MVQSMVRSRKVQYSGGRVHELKKTKENLDLMVISYKENSL